MSLPQAKKDISDHPAAGSVADPVNRDKKNADVDRKLRMYGIATAVRESRLPTNTQIDGGLEYALDHSPVPTDRLSESGQVLIRDLREILNTLRVMFQEKNAGELLQNFVWHTRSTDTNRAKKDPKDAVPVRQGKGREDANQAAQHLRTLSSLVLTNAEVRKLVGDFGVIGRDLLARGASKAAEMARPDEERLRRVDEPGPDHKFISQGGKEVGPDETPIPEARIPGTSHRIAQDPREEFGQGATVRTEGGDVRRGGDIADDAQRRKDEFTDRAQDEVQAQRDDVQENIQGDEGADTGTKKSRLQNKMAGMRDQITGRIPQEHRDKTQEHATRVKNFLSDEYFPQERRDQLIFRLKKVIIECQNHKDYQESIRWLLDTADEYITQGRTAAGKGKQSHQQLGSDDNLQLAMRELRTLLERFANGVSMDIIVNAIRQLYDDSRRDEGLRHWLREVNEFVRQCLMEAGYVLDDQCNQRANELRESGRRYYDDKYKSHFDNVWNSFAEWIAAWGNDPINRRFGQDWSRLTKDLLFDSEGSLKYKPELWTDVRRVIVPSLISHIGYIPIPRIEYTDEAFDLVLENLALSGRNVFPNVVSVDVRNHMRFSPYDTIRDESHHEITLVLGQIQADLRDVAFFYHKKTGMPKMSDSGMADVLLGGSGMTVTAHLATAHDPASVFQVKNVAVKVDSLKFAVRDSKHDALYKTIAPLATGLVKRQLQKALGGAVRTALEYLDGKLVAVRDQMSEAKASEDTSRRQVLRDQFAHKKEEAQEKGEEKPQHFKVVTSPGAELLPERGHPQGWVKRAGVQMDAARHGEEWRSDAYNL
ncbi:uncharacterized protein FIBRA_09328 [Fibroporia radiculosa]|uniref:Uncharacterized protein n=1 Tax=Fibroporia radiculosa TaxID=599839 RepID=J7S6B1_9APHY|nr:uncharacterized protein FIBRA_09328 [Fibroporia radiculosa]CCM07009.1 predicted protein [Fibroporia radiculosa]